jgi:hypothetical protein
MIVCGGRNGNMTLSSCEAYSYRLNAWSSFTSLPHPIEGAAMCWLGGASGRQLLFLFGGYDAITEKDSDIVFVDIYICITFKYLGTFSIQIRKHGLK